jgi:hypothetical protein
MRKPGLDGDRAVVMVHYRLAGAFVLLTVALAVSGFACAMWHVAGSLALWALGASGVCALVAWLALGAPLNRRDSRLSAARSLRSP